MLGFSPLDEELGLEAGSLSPRVQEGLVRLGAQMPFARAAQELAFFWGVDVSQATVRRHTEAAGAAWVAVETGEQARLSRERPPSPSGPAVQQVSVDGAMVPLVGGEWGEVKTVAIGEVKRRVRPDGEWEVWSEDFSYFSRLTDSVAFTEAALVELHRRGTERAQPFSRRAQTVVAPMDGAEWQQAFLDHHRPDAVRILDFPHAVEHLAQAGQAVYGEGTVASALWLSAQAHTLKHGDPEEVLAALAGLAVEGAPDPEAAREVRDRTLQYLRKRREQIAYADFQAAGYPIGSGSVESANKLVVEARLKGSGMHWARGHVDPMVGLREIVCGERWDEAWPQVQSRLRGQRRRRRQHGPEERPLPDRPSYRSPVAAPPVPQRARALHTPTVVNRRPTRDHPWKRGLRLLPPITAKP